MKYSLIACNLLITIYICAAEKHGEPWVYNATNKDITLRQKTIKRGLPSQAHYPLNKVFHMADWYGNYIDYVYKGNENKPEPEWGFFKTVNPRDFPDKIIPDYVVIFEPADNDVGISYRIMLKREFDEEYAKALKETQQKATTEIHKTLPKLPKGVCGIVSEYLIEKPKEL